jgi:hypothetical protein
MCSSTLGLRHRLAGIVAEHRLDLSRAADRDAAEAALGAELLQSAPRRELLAAAGVPRFAPARKAANALARRTVERAGPGLQP